MTAFVNSLRTVKHLGFLTTRAVRSRARTALDTGYRAYDRVRPYRFDPEQHRDRYGDRPRMYFLHRDSPRGTATPESAPRRIFCFWTGENALPAPRQAALESMRRLHRDLDLHLVTPQTLGGWIDPELPLHPAYPHLSFVHRSDYLRAYFMAVHGGGYSDIKVAHHDWARPFKTLNGDPSAWLIGYPERSSRSCGGDDFTVLGRQIHRRYGSLTGFGAFIMRPDTPMAWEWLQELDRRLDYYREELTQHPGNVWGDNPGYPLRWIELGSDVFHPLQLKYLPHVRQDPELLPDLARHR